MLHSYHCHPRISAGMHGPMVGNQRLHVRQGEVDATCGYHCVLMALMVLGQVRRNALIWDTRDVRLQALRKVAQRYYFDGCEVQELQQQLAPYAEQVHCKELRSRVAERTLDALAGGKLCLVCFSTERYMHWVLAVGLRFEAEEPADLLVLDPAMAPIPLVPWNAMLTGWASKQPRRVVATLSERVNIDAVLVLSPVAQAQEGE